MKLINTISNRLIFYIAHIKRVFGYFYTKDLYPQYSNCIGKYTYGLPQIFKLEKNSKFKIGKFCSIANDVKLFLDGEHKTNNITTYPFGYFKEFKTKRKYKTKSKGAINIGNDVWIGYGVTILSGVNIGDGAVIGARSLITKDVPPYAIVGGVPARLIKLRFPQGEIKRLLKIKWWNWDENQIQKNIEILTQNNISKLETSLKL